MKILIVSQYFWPENFKINDLALGLRERGYEVHVLTGIPNYPKGKFHEGYSFFSNKNESWKEIKIFRCKLISRGKGTNLRLGINYLSFAFFASIKAFFLREKYDLIFTYEPSPITVAIPAIVLKKIKKVPMYLWVQDLWPESVSDGGQFKNKTILNWLDKLTRWIYKKTDKILIQSEGFREYLLKQQVENSKIEYYPNSTEAIFKPIEPIQEIKNLVSKVPFSIMFAGNIGEAQGFENILETAKIINKKTKDIHFFVLGDGKKKEFVIQKIKEYKLEDNFHLLGAYPLETMPDFFACADALLVSLKKSVIYDLTIPGKVQSYLACGKPIIGILGGETAKLIEEAEVGVVDSTRTPKLLAEKIVMLYQMDTKEKNILSKNALRYFNNHFEREMLITKLITLFNNY